ncbi:MAG TPA: S8 family serine peptidase [Thermoanaerobaculia bacterium]|nr:S8 family serine peptidase [Thermoanaerobaculia bacterium]
MAALERGDDSMETGRYLVTFKEGAVEEGVRSLGPQGQGMRVADAREFEGQAVTLASVGGADAVVFPEIGVALVSGDAAQARGMSVQSAIAADSPVEAIEPEYFFFAQGTPGEYLRGFAQTAEVNTGEYLRGFLRAVETIARDLQAAALPQLEPGEEAMALGATWGLIACKVPPSVRSGAAIQVAVLDTGMDLGHPDFVGRPVVSQTFVGQPVQDLHSHGTHCIGTSCGPKAPAGSTPRYGIGFQALIFAGKVLTNSGSSVGGSVLAGMNWAIANRCPVISMSLESPHSPVQTAFTNAGQAALNKGCLMIAAAGNEASPTGAPANSPTIMSVASLDPNLSPSSFSNCGKIEIAAPGRDVFSSVPRPARYGIKSGTSMATPHVAGCAALWAESSASLRGLSLWRKLQATAKRLPFPATKVGAGLVQAP